MTRDSVGAFIDAVYAIAVTILALEIPATLEAEITGLGFGAILAEYALAFTILFSFWVHHRRGNGFVEEHGRAGLWLNGGILLLVCLVPRATTLVFEYGGNVTLLDIEATVRGRAGWTQSELVDLFYVVLTLLTDLLILLQLHLNTRGQGLQAQVKEVRLRKLVMTLVLVVGVGLSFTLPIQNRLVLVLIPLGLLFEDELAGLLGHSHPRIA